MEIHTNFADLTNEALAKYATEVRAAFDALVALDAPSDEQIAEAESYAGNLDAIAAEQETRATADAKKAERLAALKSKFADSDEDEEDPEDEESTEEEADEEAEDEVEVEEEKPAEKVAAASKKTVATLSAKIKRPKAPEAAALKPITITASADVPEFSTGQKMEGLNEVAKAVINRARGFAKPSGDGQTEALQQFGTAMFNLDFPEDMVVDRMDDAQEVFHRAADESRLPGGSLVAAGGWCAPSETVYDLSQDATTEGMISLPEVAVRRGGIRYAQSPVFADFYANPGFKQTESQAISGTTKPCIEIPCPSFTEVRLDAIGICIKVPILTNAAYPEVVSNFVAGTMVAHQHWVNADVIARLVAFAGAARVFANTGSTTYDTVEALGLVIDQTRQKYRLSMNQSVEVVVPFWVKNAMRADIGRRNGRSGQSVSDAEITSWTSSVGANVQFVYDWQAIDETAEVYPTTFQALVYPAGTFVKGTSDVINLNTVYDAASLAVNTYTGLFAEEGLLVAKMKFHADLLTLPICNAGRQGALNITCS